MSETSGARAYTTAVLAGPISRMLSIDWPEVVAAAGFSSAHGRALSPFVSAPDYIRLWEAMMCLTPVQDVSRLLGERLASGPAIPVLFAMSCAPNLATGLDRLMQFKHLFGPVRFTVERTRTDCTIGIEADAPGVLLPPSFSSPQLVYLHAKARALATRDFRPLTVSLPLPGRERADLADLFGSVPDEGAPRLRYAADDMTILFVSENAELWQATEQDLQAQERAIRQSPSITEQVRAVIQESLGIAEPSISTVCERLQITRSTLIRRLRLDGTTFQEVLKDTRLRLAKRYLASGDLTTQQIAHLLGYRDTNAFRRAFKAWTGTTPRQMQDRLAGGPR